MKNCRFISSTSVMASLILLLCTSGAFAENRAGTVDLTLFGGGYNVDSSLNYDSGLTWGIGLGLNTSENIGAEFTFNTVDSNHKGDKATIFLYKLDLLYYLTNDLPDEVVPYVAAGAGIVNYDTKWSGSKHNDFILNAGPGLKYFLTRNMALRGDVRYLIEFKGNTLYYNLLYCAGLTFEFGWEGQEPVVAAPPTVVAVPAIKEKKCPPAPAGCVEEDWCLKDSDGDGVPDCLDKCPGTPKGTKVDTNGCPPVVEQETIIFRNILFDFDKADLKPASFPILDEVVEYLKNKPGVRMEIQGHTDGIGTAEYNMRLSGGRANSVKKYLVKNGISTDRLETKGFGLTKPIAPNDTAQNRARNRRVEFRPLQ
jgi:OmpA-OmpF porin, OOP family